MRTRLCEMYPVASRPNRCDPQNVVCIDSKHLHHNLVAQRKGKYHCVNASQFVQVEKLIRTHGINYILHFASLSTRKSLAA